MSKNLANGDKQGLTLAALRNFLDDAERLGYPPDSIVHAETSAFTRVLRSVSVREGDTRSAAQATKDSKAARRAYLDVDTD